MKLCFGTFAKILVLCMEGMTQTKLVAKLVRCVDNTSSYISSQYRYNGSFDDIDGDKPSISKLVNCKVNFSFANGADTMQPELSEVIKKLKLNVIPFMGEKCKTKIALTLIRAIQEDQSIDSEEKDVFKRIFGYNKQQLFQQTEFLFSSLLGKILLYVVNSDIKNTQGASCVKIITQDYIDESFITFQYDYIWKEDRETFIIYSYEMLTIFNDILSQNKIDYFIEKVDPTNLFDWDIWSDRIDEFHSNLHSEIGNNSKSKTAQKIFEFDKTLDDYITYLARHGRPLAENTNIFVPMYRDENVPWSNSFSKKVNNYRERLIKINNEIYELLFYKIDKSSK